MTTLTGDRADGRTAPWVRPLVIVFLAGPVVLAFGSVAGSFSGVDLGLVAVWPAAAPAAVAVALAAGGPFPRRTAARTLLLLGVLLAVGLGSLVSRLLVGHWPEVGVGWALADVAHAAIAGLVLASGAGLDLRRVADLSRLVVGAVTGATAAGAIALLTGVPTMNDRPWELFWEVTASRVSAVVLLVPLAMHLPRRPVRASRVETVGWWVLVLVVASAVLVGVNGPPAIAFVAPAVLVVAALRLPPRGTAALLAVVGILVAGSTASDAGPLAVPDGLAAHVFVQLFGMVAAGTVLTVVLVVTARDIALEALADRRRFDRAVLDGVAAGVLACDAEGRVVLRNAAYRLVDGVDGAGRPDDDHPDPPRPRERDLVHRALAGEELRGIQSRSGTADEPRDLVADARPVHAADGRLLGMVATFTDVTDERAVQASLREAVAFHDAVLAASPDIIFITDVATHRVVWASGTIEPTLGFTPHEVVERDRGAGLNLVHPADVDALHATDDAAAVLDDGEVRTVRVRMSNDRGELRWMSRRVTPFARDADGRVVQLLGVARDVTDVVEVEQRLTDAANRDPLTGLLNRRALLDRLGVVVARTDVDAVPSPVLFCDLDGFKAVNDSLGHAAGDLLLTTMAQRIAASLRDGDTLARAGGDEFVLLLEPQPVRTDETRFDVLHRARTVARRILDTVSRPVEVQGTRLAITISIGIALVRPGIGPGEVLRDADAAMYRAKSTGKNRWHVFEVAPDRPRPDGP